MVVGVLTNIDALRSIVCATQVERTVSWSRKERGFARRHRQVHLLCSAGNTSSRMGFGRRLMNRDRMNRDRCVLSYVPLPAANSWHSTNALLGGELEFSCPPAPRERRLSGVYWNQLAIFYLSVKFAARIVDARRTSCNSEALAEFSRLHGAHSANGTRNSLFGL